MKKKLLLLLMIFSVLFLFGCNNDSNKKEAKDTIVIAQGADAKTLDPHASNDSPSTKIRMQIFDPLLKLDGDANPQPCLAESWDRENDTSIIFHIRKGVKFHNGDEMKASDVKFSIDRALASPEFHEVLDGITKVEVLDDYTIRLTTEKPMAAILNNLSHDCIVVLSEKYVKENADKIGQKPMGTGPYKFVSWESGDRVVLEAFPDYWRGEAPIKNVIFRNVVEETNRTIGLETGEIDIIYDVGSMDKNKIKEDGRFNLIEAPQARVEYLGFNVKKKPYDNPKVREAISYALDQKPIIDTVYLGAAEPATSIIGPKILYSIMAVIIQDQLKQIGIDVTIETLEWGAYLDGTGRGEQEMYLLGWTTVTRDPDYGIAELTSTETQGNAGNRSFYSNPELDKLLKAGKVEMDPEKRKEIYKQAQEIIRHDIPMYMILYPTQAVATQKNIKGFKLGTMNSYEIYEVSIQK